MYARVILKSTQEKYWSQGTWLEQAITKPGIENHAQESAQSRKIKNGQSQKTLSGSSLIGLYALFEINKRAKILDKGQLPLNEQLPKQKWLN